MTSADYQGAAVTATLTPKSSRSWPSWAAKATMKYTDGGDEVCSCSYSTATITFPTDPITEPELTHTDGTPS